MKKNLLLATLILIAPLFLYAQTPNVLGPQEVLGNLMKNPLSGQASTDSTIVFPSGLVEQGGIFDPPTELYDVINRINKANAIGMTKSQMIDFINELTQYIIDNPKQQIHGYMQLGNLYRNVLPEHLRNREKAVEMYDRVHSLLPNNSRIARGQMYYIMAHCYDYDGVRGDIFRLAIYILRAFKDSPRFACSLGDLYLCGLGCYQDLYLATLLYDLAQRNGDETAYNNLYTLDYIIRNTKTAKPNEGKAIEHFRQFLYNYRLANNIGNAEMELQAAAQLNFVPAYYVLGSMYERMLTDLPLAQRRREMFYWYRKGADANFVPCITALARCTQQYTMDSASGDIYTPEAATRGKVQATCAKQSLELYTRAANLGGTIAMHILGDLYANGGPADFPNPNPSMAYYWYSLAQRFGNLTVNDAKAKLESFYQHTAEDAHAVDHFFINHTSISSDYILKLLQEIEQHPTYKSYNHLASQTHNHTSTMDKVQELASYNAHLEQAYKLVYELYSEEISNMAQLDDNIDDTQLVTIQKYMKSLRLHESRNPLKSIKQSLWETWSSK